MTEAELSAVGEAQIEGAFRERAAIVAWLREQGDNGIGISDEGPGTLYNVADKIERGEHWA